MIKYMQEDLELAASLVDELHFSDDPAPVIAQLIADVRREAYERAAKECETVRLAYKGNSLIGEDAAQDCADRIRDLT